MVMKVKVIHEFTDRHTHERYRIGDELDLPVKRVNEIVRVGGLIEIMESEQEKEPVEEAVEDQKATGRRKRAE